MGDEHKFVSVADAIRTACRKMLDQLDEVDLRHGRTKGNETCYESEAQQAISTILEYIEPGQSNREGLVDTPSQLLIRGKKFFWVC